MKRIRLILADSENRPLANVAVSLKITPSNPESQEELREYITDGNGEIEDNSIPCDCSIELTTSIQS